MTVARSKDESIQTTRIPLVGTVNTRSYWTTGAGFDESSYVGLGIVGSMVVGALTGASQDQRFVNAYPDRVVNNFTQKETFYLVKRPGFEEHSVPAIGLPGSAIKVWTGKGTGDDLISAFGATNSTIYNDVTPIGTTSGVVQGISETTVGTTAHLVFSMSNNKGYYYPNGGVLTEITDVDYPGNAGYTVVGDFVHLDGYTFILTSNGTICNSDLNTIADWDSTNRILANMYPDQGVGLARYKDLIVAFGRESAEMFRNVGNAAGSPLQKVSEAFIRIGAVSQSAIIQLEDNIAWVASSDVGSIGVYILDGYKAVKISDATIEAQLGVRGDTEITLSCTKIFGKTFLFVIFGALTFVYVVEDKMWHEWSSANTVLWHAWAANTSSTATLYSIGFAADSHGKIYKLNPVIPVYQDDLVSYPVIIQTSKIDLDTENRKFLSRFTLVSDNTENAADCTIVWSDDDYQTWSTARTVYLSQNRHYLTNCGNFRRRAFKIANTSATPFRLQAVELEYRLGRH